ncbi:MAG: GNAT family N-acetyltransferase [Crocinitomicaceae bacterium]
MQIREIKQEDNTELARVIRSILEEHGVARPGTVYTDPTTDALFELFQKEGSVYFVALDEGKIVGGCGIFPTLGLPNGMSELVKLYLLDTYRGRGIGKELMLKSIEFAKNYGYDSLYLETMDELSNAIQLYNNLGFKTIDRPLGETGHFACEIRMVKELS